MPRSFSRLFVCSGRLRQRRARLVDEAEGLDHLVSTRFDLYLAPHTGVLARAAGDGIDASRCELSQLRVGLHALRADLPARQSECSRTLRHVGLLGGLICGVGYCAKQVEAPDPLLAALVVERGVGEAQIAVGGPSWSQVDDFALAALDRGGEGAMLFAVVE